MFAIYKTRGGLKIKNFKNIFDIYLKSKIPERMKYVNFSCLKNRVIVKITSVIRSDIGRRTSKLNLNKSFPYSAISLTVIIFVIQGVMLKY